MDSRAANWGSPLVCCWRLLWFWYMGYGEAGAHRYVLRMYACIGWHGKWFLKLRWNIWMRDILHHRTLECELNSGVMVGDTQWANIRQIGCFTCPISILKSIFSSTEAVICMQIQHCNTCFPRDIDALPIITTRSTSNTPYHTRTKDQIPHGVYLRLPQRTLDPHRSISSVLLTGPAESTDQLAPANNGIWYHMHHLRHTEWTAWDERCLIKFVLLLIVFLLLSWYWGWVG